MTVPAPLAFPGGRTLAGWWRQLAPWKLRTWWVGHLFLHRVEALVRKTRPVRPDPLHTLILKAVALHADESAERLNQRLHLGEPIVSRVLRSLTDSGLLAADASRLVPTSSGREVLAHGEYRAAVLERSVFYFAEPGVPDRPPHFLPLQDPPSVFLPAADDWRFDPGWLAECTSRPTPWKQRFGFPTEVEEVLLASNQSPAPSEAWRRVVLDRSERLPTVMGLAPRPEGGERLVAFAVRTDGWLVQAEPPLFSLEEDWQEAFPTLVQGPSPAEWEDAWRTWCQPRGLPLDTGPIHAEGHRLRVTVSPRLLERLRSSRSDALKGDAWILAGTGRLRAAAQIEIVESEARPALRQA